MKKIVIFFLILIYCQNLFSQGTTCQTAVPFCLDSTHLYQLDTMGTAQPCIVGGYSCYGCMVLNRSNPKWFWLKVKTSGVLGFNIFSVNNLGFNYVAWGPFHSHTNICDSLTTSNIVSCYSDNDTYNGATIGYAISGTYYFLCITNSTNQHNSIYFSQVGNGLASTDCDIISGIDNNQINSIVNQTILYQNVPNPFKTLTSFSYQLGESGFVELVIINQFGKEIDKLVNAKQEKGVYSINWNCTNISQDTYYCILRVNNKLISKKAIKLN